MTYFWFYKVILSPLKLVYADFLAILKFSASKNNLGCFGALTHRFQKSSYHFLNLKSELNYHSKINIFFTKMTFFPLLDFRKKIGHSPRVNEILKDFYKYTKLHKLKRFLWGAGQPLDY